LPEDRVVKLGEYVSGGGYYPHLPDFSGEFLEALKQCPSNEYAEVAAFNTSGEVAVGG